MSDSSKSVFGSDTGRDSRPRWFTTTHWSAVLAAGGADSVDARAGLEKLCQTYWYPLYAYVRRLGHSAHDAEDLIQGFFAQALEKNYFAAADRSKGRFRSFLLVALKRFMANEWNRSRTGKRGSGKPPISLDALSAEQRYALEPGNELTADKLFERRWALTLLETVLNRLAAEQRRAGRRSQFDHLKEFLTSGSRGTPHAEVARALGMSAAAVKVAVHRLKRRYRELLEEEIATTVSTPEQIAEERRHLLEALAASK
jgi:RNA polymerase sigma factor (sigma-70 family)